jgi:hypothetical protein
VSDFEWIFKSESSAILSRIVALYALLCDDRATVIRSVNNYLTDDKTTRRNTQDNLNLMILTFSIPSLCLRSTAARKTVRYGFPFFCTQINVSGLFGLGVASFKHPLRQGYIYFPKM